MFTQPLKAGVRRIYICKARTRLSQGNAGEGNLPTTDMAAAIGIYPEVAREKDERIKREESAKETWFTLQERKKAKLRTVGCSTGWGGLGGGGWRVEG